MKSRFVPAADKHPQILIHSHDHSVRGPILATVYCRENEARVVFSDKAFNKVDLGTVVRLVRIALDELKTYACITCGRHGIAPPK